MTVELHLGDCLDVLRTLPDASVDCVVTDPPYGLGFMGKDWDHGVPGVAFWEAIRRVMKPGTFLLAFGGTRTFHRQVCAIEDAGFQIRDTLNWLYGQGFPKAKSCLKPAWEPITLALNPGKRVPPLPGLDGCRVGMTVADAEFIERTARPNSRGLPHIGPVMNRPLAPTATVHPAGRWPANVVLSHADGCNGVCVEDCPVRVLGEQSGVGWAQSRYSNNFLRHPKSGFLKGSPGAAPRDYHEPGETTAARFFYCSKVSSAERDGSTHPTMKPLALMRWLCRLITPPGGTVLDPFAGSGSTLVAAVQEGFDAIGIESNPEYHAIARRRIDSARDEMPLFSVGTK